MSRKLFLALLTVGLLAVPAAAQEAGAYTPFEVNAGFVLNRHTFTSFNVAKENIVGFTGGAAYYFHPNFGVFGEFSRQGGEYSDFAGLSFSQTQFLFGPRAAFRREKFTTVVQGLFGLQRYGIPDQTFSETEFAWGVGGGLDIDVSDKITVRAVQLDFLTAEYEGGEIMTDNIRFTFGVVFKLGGN